MTKDEIGEETIEKLKAIKEAREKLDAAVNLAEIHTGEYKKVMSLPENQKVIQKFEQSSADVLALSKKVSDLENAYKADIKQTYSASSLKEEKKFPYATVKILTSYAYDEKQIVPWLRKQEYTHIIKESVDKTKLKKLAVGLGEDVIIPGLTTSEKISVAFSGDIDEAIAELGKDEEDE